MPIKMGDQTYQKFEDASKSVQQKKGLSKDRANAYVATIDRKQNEAVEPDQTQSLTTPNAGDVKTEDTQDLTSPQGSSREAENPQASGRGELSPTNPTQDQAEPTANPQDQAEPANAGHQTAGEQGDLVNRKEQDYKNPEDEFKDKKRDDQQSLEYNGESYHKIESLEYDGDIYIQKDDKEEASEDDLEYEDKYWEKAGEDVLELDNDYYVKDAEEQDMGTNISTQPTNAITTPELNPTTESIIIKESNGKYKKYNIFQATEQEDSVDKAPKVDEIPSAEIPQGNTVQKTNEPKTEPVEQKDPVEEVIAVEKIIIKENGKLKFKTVFQESKKKALEIDSIGNCDFCKGTGKVTVEHLGLKDCPRCGGDGNVDGMQPNESGMGQQQPQGQNPQQNDTFSQPKGEEQPVQNLQEPQQEQPLQQKQQTDDSQQSKIERPYEEESLKKSLECNVCPKSMKQFEGWVQRKLTILKQKRPAYEGVGLLFGLPTIEQEGKKIKGVLAYAGVSLNNRIYLPEELAKGDGRTLPLLLNHSNVAGAEEELDRLDDKMRGALENQEDFQVGWVKLRWEPEELTLYYEGVITDPFFQKEVDDAKMAVSLGIWYDSDSPRVCDQECYTLIRGAEFREVSLVYHPGFPIATIEAVEVKLKERAKKIIVAESLASSGTNWAGTMTFTSPITTTSTGTIPTHSYSISGVESIGISTDGHTANWVLDGNNAFVSLSGREAKLQPYYSLPRKTREEADKLKKDIPVQDPEDTMKDEEK